MAHVHRQHQRIQPWCTLRALCCCTGSWTT